MAFRRPGSEKNVHPPLIYKAIDHFYPDVEILFAMNGAPEPMQEYNLTAIENTIASDIFICSYPRSGVTWFQNLIAGLVFGVDPRFTHDALIQDLVPDIHQAKWFKRYGRDAYFKSHLRPQPHYRRVINLVRDGRDAIVSYHHFLCALSSGADLLQIAEGNVWPCAWHEHVDAWLENPYKADILLVRYEELSINTVSELVRIAKFIGLDREKSYLEFVAQRAAFANAQAKEREQGWSNAIWPRDKPFVRRGKIGSYRDEMPIGVQSAFLKHSEASLRRLGYL